MTTMGIDFLKKFGFDITTPHDQLIIDRSVIEHTRNGRGFWPVITVDGIPQVVRFSAHPPLSSSPSSPSHSSFTLNEVDHHLSIKQYDHDRWTPTTGSIDLVPLHTLPVSDWPRVRMAG